MIYNSFLSFLLLILFLLYLSFRALFVQGSIVIRGQFATDQNNLFYPCVRVTGCISTPKTLYIHGGRQLQPTGSAAAGVYEESNRISKRIVEPYTYETFWE